MVTESTETRGTKVRLGSRVVCRDGQAGRVDRIVINPRQRQVTHLIIREEPGGKIVVAPFEAVTQVTDESVTLALSRDELGQLPEYQPEQFVSPVPGWRSPEGYTQEETLFAIGEPATAGQPQAAAGGVTPDVTRPEGVEAGIEIRRGTPVYCHDGKVGTVDLVLLDAKSGRISHLVLRQGFLLTKDRAVPIEWAREISARRVYLDVGKAQLEALPEYRPDAEILAAVREALWDYEPVRSLDLPAIALACHDGVVTLRGHVRALSHKIAIRQIVRSVPGVKEVQEELIADDDLALQVAQAIARDPRTAKLTVEAEAFLGAVHLSGRVPTRALKQACEEIAAAVPGVRGVINGLVAEEEPEAAVHPEPPAIVRFDVPVYCRIGVCGHVAYVAVQQRSDQRWGVSHVGVRTEGGVRAVPVRLLDFWSGVGLFLAIFGDALEELPSQPPPGTAVLQRGLIVRCRDGELGRLNFLLVAPQDYELTGLVVREHRFTRREVVVGQEQIAAVSGGSITLTIGLEERDALPEFQPPRPDPEVDTAVERALMRHLGFATAGYQIRVATKDGIVSLEGTVPSAAMKEEAERIARSISGVWRVVNHLDVRSAGVGPA